MAEENMVEVLHEGKFLRFVKRGHWEYVDRTNATGVVVVVALTADRRVVLVEQFRPPVGKRTLELPAGLAGDLLEHRNEAIVAAARRELLEETGYEAESWELVATGPISSGLSSEVAAVYLARPARQVEAGGGHEGEEIQVHAVSVRQAESWLEERMGEGILVDPKVYAALYFAVTHRP